MEYDNTIFLCVDVETGVFLSNNCYSLPTCGVVFEFFSVLVCQDVMILDQSVFFGVADIHDRHRDMRLDVDNMSYEVKLTGFLDLQFPCFYNKDFCYNTSIGIIGVIGSGGAHW